MESTIEKQEDGTIKITITIPYKSVKETRDEIVKDITKNAKVPGFRKGKAPSKIVENKIDESVIREEVLKKLLPLAYSDAIKTHNLKPIINPKIHVEKLEDPSTSSGQADWQFVALTCEAPVIDLNGYKESIKKLTAKTKIAIPNKEPETVSLEEIVAELLKNVKIKIAKIIIEQEVQRLLAQTLDEIKRLGLTLDQYLASTGKTIENLQAEYEQKAQNDIKLEFALQKIADDEDITVADSEINDTITKAKNDEERKNLEANKYLLASVIRQQKTLDFLKNL